MRRCLLILLLLPACNSDPASDSALPTPPASPVAARNVVLITIDTLRGDVLGYTGGPAHTPVLDALGGSGWSFENCISASMLTNPSHASIMTSLYPRDHGVYDNESGIADGLHTLASAMHRQGKRTMAIIGFPHLNPEVSNLGIGFDKVVRAQRHERRASETSARALEAIDHVADGEPFFLWVHYVDPHAPYVPSQEMLARQSRPATRTPMAVALRVAPGFQRHNPWFKRAFREIDSVEEMHRRYLAEVETADAGVGDLLDGLRQRKMLRDTVVAVTADHGENFGEHHLYFHHGGLHRETVHVPLIVAGPTITSRRISGLVSSVDIAPTLLDLAAAPRWQPMRGHSLVALALGRSPPRRFAFSEHMLAQQVSVRSEEGTLILHRASSQQFPNYHFVKGKREVYDATLDSGETRPLDDDFGPANALRNALSDYLGAGLNLNARRALAQDRESLRALGYLE